MRLIGGGSSSSSLCTFLPTILPPSAGFAQDYPIAYCDLGFPEFTRFFNHSLLWKLQSGMKLTMTIRTENHAFIEFLSDLFPAASTTASGNAKVLFRGVDVMKL